MKKIVVMLCMLSIFGTVMAGCGNEDEEQKKPTQPPTQQQTQAPTPPPTKPPTQPPTQPPTEAPTPTDPPTQAEYIPPEPETFAIIIEEPITTPPPTEKPTVPVTEEQQPTQPSTEFYKDNEIIEGEWYLAYYERAGGGGRHVAPRTTVSYEFNIDGTFTVTNNGIEMTGRYSFNGKTLYYVSDSSGETGAFTFDEEKDILTDEDEGNLAVLVRED